MKKQYYKLTQLISIAAGRRDTVSITIPDDKGRAVAFDLLPVSSTAADLADISVNAYANGNQFLQDATALEYSSIFQRQNTRLPIDVSEKATIRVAVQNDSAATQEVFAVIILEK